MAEGYSKKTADSIYWPRQILFFQLKIRILENLHLYWEFPNPIYIFWQHRLSANEHKLWCYVMKWFIIQGICIIKWINGSQMKGDIAELRINKRANISILQMSEVHLVGFQSPNFLKFSRNGHSSNQCSIKENTCVFVETVSFCRHRCPAAHHAARLVSDLASAFQMLAYSRELPCLAQRWNL